VSRSVLLYLDDIDLCCRRIIEYARDLDLEGFLSQHMTRDAILHNIQTIGEAAGRLPHEFRDQYPDVDWRGIISLRNTIVHGYTDLNYDIVWSIVTTDVPALLPAVEAMIAEAPSEE
jgi:uncharacterized protein with HEPN domain